MTFDDDTFRAICEVLAQADHGCPSCTQRLAQAMAVRFPDQPWLPVVRGIVHTSTDIVEWVPIPIDEHF